MIKISIIIVTYNAAKYIEDALNSILRQDYENFECLIIDGNSKDNTIDIIKNYCKKSNKIRYISENDNGIYDAMNKGYNLSRGEWILYLGADDMLCDNILPLIDKEITDDVDIIYGNYYISQSNNKIKKMFSLDYKCITYKVFSNHQAVIMKRDVIKQLGGFNTKYKITADFDLIQRAYINKYTFKQIPLFISIFSTRGISSNNFSTSYEWWQICKINKSTKFHIIVLLYAILRDIKNRFIQL